MHVIHLYFKPCHVAISEGPRVAFRISTRHVICRHFINLDVAVLKLCHMVEPHHNRPNWVFKDRVEGRGMMSQYS